MGDIIQKFRVRPGERGPGKLLRLYFDTGTLNSFAKVSVATHLGSLLELPEPKSFGSLGDGHFLACSLCHFNIRLLDFWCSHTAYVVEDHILGDDYDMLIGHNFTQSLNVRCDPRGHRVILDRVALRLAQTVR